MLSRLVRPQVVAMFDRVSSGDTAGILRGLAADVEHRFAGDHPLAGHRIGKPAVEQWFDRLHRLFPELSFDIGRVAASGRPWNMIVTVEWIADVTPAHGPRYLNHGAHVLRLARGKVASFHAYEDSQAVARACALMAQAGIAEASSPPIESHGLEDGVDHDEEQRDTR